MRELDTMLEGFLHDRFDTMRADERADFSDLLTHSDPDLFAWITGKTHPAEARYAKLVQSIRENSTRSSSTDGDNLT